MVQIVLCGRSSQLRKQALRDPKLTLKDLLVLGRQCDRSRQQAAEIEENTRNNQTGMNDDAVVDAVRDIPLLERHRKKGFAGIVVLNGHTTREYVQQRAKNAENVPN
jgi:hypothetical protein